METASIKNISLWLSVSSSKKKKAPLQFMMTEIILCTSPVTEWMMIKLLGRGFVVGKEMLLIPRRLSDWLRRINRALNSNFKITFALTSCKATARTDISDWIMNQSEMLRWLSTYSNAPLKKKKQKKQLKRHFSLDQWIDDLHVNIIKACLSSHLQMKMHQ